MQPCGFSVQYSFKNPEEYKGWLKLIEYDVWEEWSKTTGTRKECVVVDKKSGCTIKTVHLKGRIETYYLQVFETTRIKAITGDEERSIYLKINGSLHGNYINIRGKNDRWLRQNYERFTFDQLQQEISNLCTKAKIDPIDTILRSIEFGINIQTPFHVDTLLERSVLLHKTNSPERYTDGLGIFFDHGNPLKIYNKGKQFGLPGNLMRIEIAFKEMKVPKRFGIRTLADLRDKNKLLGLAPLLMGAIDDLYCMIT